MITQEQAPIFTNYGPLATQYLTGGQMGYMPQAQYLTPAEYGAFRTLPGPTPTDYQNQMPGLLQSWMIRNYGAPFGLPKYTFNTYNPAVNQQQYMSAIRRHSSDQMLALGGTVLDFGVSSLAFGALGGIPGALAGLAMPSLAAPVVDRVRDLRAIQNLTMPKITGGRDVNLATGMGFNAASARSIDSFTRASAAGDVLFKEGDYRRMLQLGVENGMFDYAGSAAQYKDIIKKLRDTMTTVMEVTGSTDFKDLMKEFKRLQTMGADISRFRDIMRKENMFSRMAGMSHSDMVNTYGQQGAFLFSSMGLNNYQGSIQAMGNAAMITQAQRMGLINPAMVARHGGVSGMVQTMTQQDAAAQTKIRDLLLSYLANDSMTGLDRNVSPMDILNSKNPMNLLVSRSGRLNHLDSMMAFQRNKPDLWGEAVDKYGGDVLGGIMAHAIGKQVGRSGMAATEFGYRMEGYSPEIASIKARQLHSDDFRDQVAREAHLARQKRREEEDLAANPFRRLARDFDKTLTKFSEATFGRIAEGYAGFVERNDAIANGVVPDFGNVNIGRTDTTGALADEKTRQNAAKVAQGMSLSKDESIWTTGALDPDEWERRNPVMLSEETSGEGMKKVSFRVKGGQVSGRAKYDKKKKVWHGYADTGGSSFGSHQFTTQNLISFLNKPENRDLLEAFRAEGIDLAKGSADVDVLERARTKLGDKRLREITGRSESEVNKKIEAAGLGLTAAETEKLGLLQGAWDNVLKSGKKDRMRQAYYEEAREQYTHSLYRKAGGKESWSQILGMMLKDEGFRRVLTDQANNRGPGGWSKEYKKYIGAEADYRILAENVSVEEARKLLSSTEGKKQLLDRLYAAVRVNLPSSNGAYGRYEAGSAQTAKYKAMFDVLDGNGSGTAPATQTPTDAKLDEDIERFTNELLISVADQRGVGFDDNLDVLQRRKEIDSRAYFGSGVLRRVMSSTTIMDDAKLLSGKLGMKVSKDTLEALTRDMGIFSTVSYTELKDAKTRKEQSRRIIDRLVKQQQPDLDEKTHGELVDALSGDTDVQTALAAASLRGAKDGGDDAVSRRFIDWKRGEYDETVRRGEALNRKYADMSAHAWNKYADKAFTGLEHGDLETIRKAMSSNARYGQLVYLRALTRMYNFSSSKDVRASLGKEIHRTAGLYGMDDKAVERMILEGTFRADEIKSFGADQRTLDSLGEIGGKLGDRHKALPDIFIAMNREAMGGAHGAVARDILVTNEARWKAGLHTLAGNHGYASVQDAVAHFDEFQRRVNISGSEEDKRLVKDMAAEKQRTGSIDLGRYSADVYTAEAAKTLDAASASAQTDPGMVQADALREIQKQQADYFAGNKAGTADTMADTMQGLTGTLNTLNDTLKGDLVTTLNGVKQTLAGLQKKL